MTDIKIVYSSEEQLKLWLQGIPSHYRHMIRIMSRGKLVRTQEFTDCLPDFSCCKPELLAPVEVREAFVNGDEKLRSTMCMTFLGNLIATMPDKRVHITNGDYSEFE